MPWISASGVIEPMLISVPVARVEAKAWLSRVRAVTLRSIIAVDPVRVGGDEGRDQADAGVVDERRDRGVLAQPRVDRRQVTREVGLDDLGVGEALAHRVAAAGDEHEVMPAGGELFGVGGADATRRAGDEGFRCHTSSIAR